MLYVTKMGPFSLGKVGPFSLGEGCIYVALSDSREPGLLAEKDDVSALRACTKIDGATAPWLCDDRIGEAGASLGFAVAPPPEEVLRPLADVAMLLGSVVSLGDSDVLPLFTEGAAEFHSAAPWKLWSSDHRLDIAVDGPDNRVFEGFILGSGEKDPGPGLILHLLSTTITQASASRPSEQAEVLALSFKTEPEFAARALQSGYGLPGVPTPLRIHRGETTPATEEELLVLAAVLRAASKLTPTGLQSGASVTVSECTISARVSAPPPVWQAIGPSGLFRS